ncbi:MAG: polysaccharide biosynthesis protein, partial [Romboutsia sp.]
MRTKKSAINMITAFICQFIVILLGFISRRVMIDSVGVEYLGINGLMNNILTILSLAESGIGVAIIYSLYKPLAENDVQKIKGLMNFYKYTYRA